MDWQEIQRRLLECLYRELRGNWGSIGEIEERLGISEGYLAKLCQGRNDIKLGLFLKAIDALGLDQQAFLSRALELQPAPEDYLRQLEEPDDQDRAFTHMARATAELETAEPPSAHASATASAEDVADFAACKHAEQLRRLRATRKYRTHAFARAYLEHLDALRYDHAEEAAKLATQVAVHLVPALPGPQDERLALQCLALGIFGSARRLKGKGREASEIATSMAPLLFRFKNNRLAEAAIVELISAALKGRLHEDLVREARAKLGKERTPDRGAPSRQRWSSVSEVLSGLRHPGLTPWATPYRPSGLWSPEGGRRRLGRK